ncbi:glucose-1-phosphate adenylyltransferase [Mesobacillus persicus]|uniref:Glucose-1-phosphate adenylyltransferase n=1 Tax=Mesobacillus persicus TaxID=930146 RepID=A0A1H7Y5H3_9BACI|nr:sugar phosphate nucleotidyltransferase [Mesobacillus persicus]SEM41134.1 glucose-1-phosphate adenylyltransferase [Mesobacillus persicus]
MKKRLLGVIDATTYAEDLKDLTLHRSVAAIPFGGRYRLIDFILSNMVNSGIESVGIFPKYPFRSLMDHLGSGKNWDLNRKRDGLFFFPFSSDDKPNFGMNSFEHFAANIDFLNRSTQEYCLISDANTIFNMDFNPLLEWHMEQGCDISEVRRDGAPLNIFLVKTSLLLELIDSRDKTGNYCMRDVVTDIDSPYQVCYYPYEGFAVTVDSIDQYYFASMEILKPTIWGQLFLKERAILTKVKDEPPTHYSKSASVHNSMIANGASIEGIVENSIIARGVKIAKGAIVRNSIIMQKTQIGENSILDHVIVDKDVKVESGITLIGTKDAPKILQKGSIIKGACVNS